MDDSRKVVGKKGLGPGEKAKHVKKHWRGERRSGRRGDVGRGVGLHRLSQAPWGRVLRWWWATMGGGGHEGVGLDGQSDRQTKVQGRNERKKRAAGTPVRPQLAGNFHT